MTARQIADQAFGGGFHHAGLAGAGRPQEQKVADRPAGAGHSRQVRLIDVDDLLDRLVLADDALAQVRLQLLRFESRLRRIQLFVQPPHTLCSPFLRPFSARPDLAISNSGATTG